MTTPFSPITVTAKNFAIASENKMHDDVTAAEFGFRGGLVPGVGVYGYMTMPVVRELGVGWLGQGRMWGKFLKPVYDGESVRVEAEVVGHAPTVLETRVLNGDGVLCAVGRAEEVTYHPAPRIEAYPAGVLPDAEQRPPGDLDHLPVRTVLGGLEMPLDLPNLRGESGDLFAHDMVDDAAQYRGADALCHPAFYPAMANRILTRNVKLGPWIHTESTVEHYRLLRNGETLRVRGRVVESVEKRGHEFVQLDVALFGDDPVAVAQVMHTAIVRPAVARASHA
jgi:acyl dehydratase